jgi:hypothetical protein
MFCFEMYRKSKKEAILAWNTRFPPPNQPGFDEMYEALKRILTDESEPCERCCGNGKLSRGPRYNDRTLACSQCDGKGRIFADFKEIARAALAKADGKQAQS